jgi:large subunit ribosomal protein L25
MEIPTLKAEPRQAAGSRAAARLRRDGKLPAVVYGHKQSSEPVSLNYHDVELHLEHGLHVIKLDMSGQVQPCQFKQAQYDYLGSTLVHVDLIRVDLSERVKVTVPLEFRGTPKGAVEGGQIRNEMSDVEIECVVSEIPELIRVDVSDLGLDDVLHVKDITLPDGATLVSDPEAAVAVVRLPITVEAEEGVAAETAEGEAAAEPEVIARGKPAEESEDKDKS